MYFFFNSSLYFITELKRETTYFTCLCGRHTQQLTNKHIKSYSIMHVRFLSIFGEFDIAGLCDKTVYFLGELIM